MKRIRLDQKKNRELLKDLLKRDPGSMAEYEGTVRKIVDDVRTGGDRALIGYTEQFDHLQLTPDTMQVQESEISAAMKQVDGKLIGVIQDAIVNIRAYHEKQKRTAGSTPARTERSSVRK